MPELRGREIAKYLKKRLCSVKNEVKAIGKATTLVQNTKFPIRKQCRISVVQAEPKYPGRIGDRLVLFTQDLNFLYQGLVWFM